MDAPNYEHIDPPNSCGYCQHFDNQKCGRYPGVEMYDFVAYGDSKPFFYICDDFVAENENTKEDKS